jgi:hypothetical protein
MVRTEEDAVVGLDVGGRAFAVARATLLSAPAVSRLRGAVEAVEAFVDDYNTAAAAGHPAPRVKQRLRDALELHGAMMDIDVLAHRVEHLKRTRPTHGDEEPAAAAVQTKCRCVFIGALADCTCEPRVDCWVPEPPPPAAAHSFPVPYATEHHNVWSRCDVLLWSGWVFIPCPRVLLQTSLLL